MITQVILIYKSNRCYNWQLKGVQKGLKKRGFNFSCDSPPDWEKESVIKSKKKKKMYLIILKICVIAGNGSRGVVSHQIFLNLLLFLIVRNIPIEPTLWRIYSLSTWFEHLCHCEHLIGFRRASRGWHNTFSCDIII